MHHLFTAFPKGIKEADDTFDAASDCGTCTTAALENLFAGCVNWEVDELTRGTNDLQSNYNGYRFTVNSNGNITVVQNTTYNPTNKPCNKHRTNLAATVTTCTIYL
jgi:hypothetical protein